MKTKNQFYKIMAGVLAVVMIFAVAPKTAIGANITGLQSAVAAYGNGGGTGSLSTNVSGQTITISGSITGATQTLSLDIDLGITVVWAATLTSDSEYGSGLVALSGTGGTFEMTDGNIIATTKPAIYATGADTKVVVSGGMVQTSGADNNNPTIYMFTAPADTSTVNVTVNGTGSVSALYASGNAIKTSGSVMIDGSANVSAEYMGIAVDGANSMVNVSGNGTVNTTTGFAICTLSNTAGVTVAGGLVEATGNGGRAIEVAGGTVKVLGGIVRASGAYSHTIDAFFDSNVIVTGGLVENTNGDACAIYTDLSPNPALVSITIGGTAVVRLINTSGGSGGKAISTKSSMLVSGGTIEALVGRAVEPCADGVTINVTGGTIRADMDRAIWDSVYSDQTVNVSGGLIRAATNCAIELGTNSTVNITGGAVFAYGSAITGTNNVIKVTNYNQPSNDGVAVAWNKIAGTTSYIAGTSNHLVCQPSFKAVWESNGADSGIYYNNGTATGFIKISDVTVAGGDSIAPTLLAGAVDRTSNTAATVKFSSDEAGEYYYEVVDSGAAPPSIITTGTGIACGTTENTINLTLTAGAKDIYIVVKDAAGNVSAATFKITIPAYDNAPTATLVDANAAAPVVGTQLTGSYTYNTGTGSGAGADASTFQWYRSTANTWSGAIPEAISGATAITYAPTGADVGKYLYFEVTPTNGTLPGTAVQSAASGLTGIMVSLMVNGGGTSGAATINGGAVPVKVTSTTSPIVAATLGNATSVAWTVSLGGGSFTNSALVNPGYSLPTMNNSVTGPITITATFTAATKSVTVGSQTGTLTEGTAGSVTYTVTTANIANGTHSVTLGGAPTGVTAGSVTISGNSGTLTLNSTTATPQGTHAMTITIDSTVSASFNLVVDAPASVGNVIIGGTTGTPLTAQTATITLATDTLAAALSNADVSGWFTGLPTGVTATANGTAGGSTITITFGGTPTAASSAAFSITIHGTALWGGVDITVAANANAKFNITQPGSTGVSGGSSGGSSNPKVTTITAAPYSTGALLTIIADGGSSNLTYQWQSKQAGGKWVNISGATGASFDMTGLTPGETYTVRCTVKTSTGRQTTSSEVTFVAGLSGKGAVTGNNVKVRNLPETKGKVIGKLNKDNAVTILGFEAPKGYRYGFYRIAWDNELGYAYVSADYVNAIFSAPLGAKITGRLYLQDRMSTSKRYRVAALTNGDTIKLIGRYKSWWLVDWDGETAYLKNAKYVSVK